MPSPFPGMDPYLEGDDWTSFRAHLDHPLPNFGVPLMEGDADVSLDLQSCFQNVYNGGGFDLILDYSKPPAVPLSADQAAWVNQRLSRAGKTVAPPAGDL